MAVHYPGARFVGIDVSSTQVKRGRALAERYGVGNLELIHADILSLDSSWVKEGQFDYIIAHGVYSWVPGEVQRHLMSVAPRLLKPSGLMYVSYNVNPGWQVRSAVREMMQYFGARFSDPRERVRQARALVEFVADAARERVDDPLVKGLVDESRRLAGYPDYYVLHEYLEPCNEALYFHEFARRAKAAGLAYVGDARPATMSTRGLPADVAQGLRAISRDLIELEQFMDMLRSRSFRESILCRADAAPDCRPSADRLVGLHFAAARPVEPVRPMASQPDDAAGAVLSVLAQRAPASVGYGELMDAAAAMLGGGDVRPRVDQALLRMTMESTDLVDVLLSPLPLTAVPGDRPTACPLVRKMAADQMGGPEAGAALRDVMGEAGMSEEVCTRRHTMVELPPQYRRLVVECDGRPRGALRCADEDLAILARHGLMIA